HKRADKFSDQFTSHCPSLFKKVHPPCSGGNTAMIASAEVLGIPIARTLGPGSSRPGCTPHATAELPRSVITGPRAARGHVTTAPPSSVMNSRRSTAQYLPCLNERNSTPQYCCTAKFQSNRQDLLALRPEARIDPPIVADYVAWRRRSCGDAMVAVDLD